MLTQAAARSWAIAGALLGGIVVLYLVTRPENPVAD